MKEQRQGGVSLQEAHQQGQSPIKWTLEEMPRVAKGISPGVPGKRKREVDRYLEGCAVRGRGSAGLPFGAGGSLSEVGGQAGTCPLGGQWQTDPGQRRRGHRWAPCRLSLAGCVQRSREHLTRACRAGEAQTGARPEAATSMLVWIM